VFFVTVHHGEHRDCGDESGFEYLGVSFPATCREKNKKVISSFIPHPLAAGLFD